MAMGALFIGWGQAVHGREQKALEVFQEALRYSGRLQQDGEIQSFEPVALEPHGGDLAGFLLINGDPDPDTGARMHNRTLRNECRLQSRPSGSAGCG